MLLLDSCGLHAELEKLIERKCLTPSGANYDSKQRKLSFLAENALLGVQIPRKCSKTCFFTVIKILDLYTIVYMAPQGKHLWWLRNDENLSPS